MAFHLCQIPNCENLALIKFGDCEKCDRHICGQHIEDAKSHVCVLSGDELDFTTSANTYMKHDRALRDWLDVPRLSAEAASLRPGHTCSGPPGMPLSMRGATLEGGCNYHQPLKFDDGVRWVVRIRKRSIENPPTETMRFEMESEAATLEVLHRGGVKVPQVWYKPHDSAIPDDFCYFYQEFVYGDDCDVMRFEPAIHQNGAYNPDFTPSETTLQVIHHIASWFIDLEKVTFDRVGSVCRGADGSTYVGPTMLNFVTQNEPPYYPGPFDTAKARYLAVVNIMLKQTLDGMRAPRSQALRSYIALLEVRSLIEECEEMEAGPWYIKHGEDKGDHFRHAKDYSVTGVLDWQWSFITCKGDAFAAPMGFLDGRFYAGDNTLTSFEAALAHVYEKDFGRPDLADCVRNGKKYQRLSECLRLDEFDPKQMMGMRQAFRNEDSTADRQAYTEEEWTKSVVSRFRDDVGLCTLLAMTPSNLE